MLNISAISYHTTTGRSNSFDISDLNSSPRNKLLLKHAMKSSYISTTYDTKQHTTSPIPSKEDLQSKIAFLTAEVERLTAVNSELLAEIGDWKKHFREAEKLIGKNATITITKNVVDEQVNQRCRELEALVADLTARLKNATLLESNQKRHGAEMTPKAKGDLTFRTPRFAKGDIRPLWESSPNYEGKRSELLNLKAVSLQQQLCNIEEKIPSENIEELSEGAEPIYMKALVFEDSIEKCEKRIDLSIVEAIKGDDALSLDQSFSESLNRLNRSLDNAETFIEGIPKTCASSRDQRGECCENRRIELEKLREEVRKLRRDVNGYEGVAIVLSKKAQEAIRMKKEKEILEQELNICNQKLAENEKNHKVFNGQSLDENQRKGLEITNKQSELLKEKECLILELNEIRNELKSGLQREDKLKLELCNLTQVLEENKETLKACEQQKSKFQGRVIELDEVVEKLNTEIGAWKEEYGKLENRIKQQLQQAESEQKEKKVVELLKENSSLNETITTKLNEIEELRRSHKRVIEQHKEEINQKWLKSCVQMEEIALSLESRKNNMQAQLERMQAISGENAQELEELYKQNESIRKENRVLLEEMSQLRAKEEQYKQLLNGLKDRLCLCWNTLCLINPLTCKLRITYNQHVYAFNLLQTWFLWPMYEFARHNYVGTCEKV